MESIIKELWHGNIIPQDDSRNNSPEVKNNRAFFARWLGRGGLESSLEEGYAARGENCANRSASV